MAAVVVVLGGIGGHSLEVEAFGEMTGNAVPLDLARHRVFDPAAIGGEGAARMEGAAGWAARRIGDLALETQALANASGTRIGPRHGSEQGGGIGMAWARKQSLVG